MILKHTHTQRFQESHNSGWVFNIERCGFFYLGQKVWQCVISSVCNLHTWSLTFRIFTIKLCSSRELYSLFAYGAFFVEKWFQSFVEFCNIFPYTSCLHPTWSMANFARWVFVCQIHVNRKRFNNRISWHFWNWHHEHQEMQCKSSMEISVNMEFPLKLLHAVSIPSIRHGIQCVIPFYLMIKIPHLRHLIFLW